MQFANRLEEAFCLVCTYRLLHLLLSRTIYFRGIRDKLYDCQKDVVTCTVQMKTVWSNKNNK